MKKWMIGYDFLDGRNRRLEYQKSSPPHAENRPGGVFPLR
jgi:hypothetical protein